MEIQVWRLCKVYKRRFFFHAETIILPRLQQLQETPSHIFPPDNRYQQNPLTSPYHSIIVNKAIYTAAMHFSILLVALVGLTSVAARPATPSDGCLQECNDAYTECDDTSGNSSGFYAFGEQIAW